MDLYYYSIFEDDDEIVLSSPNKYSAAEFEDMCLKARRTVYDRTTYGYDARDVKYHLIENCGFSEIGIRGYFSCNLRYSRNI